MKNLPAYFESFKVVVSKITEQIWAQNTQIQPPQIKSLDDLFTLFNTAPASFGEKLAEKITTITSAQLTAQQKTAVEKLENALKHFGNKNEDGKLSSDQMQMLKNNTTFMKFIGWVCSLLPEFLQIGPIGNCAKRYHVSRFEKESLSPKPSVPAIAA